ncbi:MAG: hypothetical protein KGJ59_11475 [Bacteroidota bacterium]|nr:hypothetical protein [Bacteroidota bacterium]
MKNHLLVLTSLTFAFLLPVAARSQTLADTVVLSTRVGEVIDQTERTQYNLFPADTNFVSAIFFRASDSSFFARVVSLGLDGKQVVKDRPYPAVLLLQLAEKINHYEDLVAGNYTMGTDPATIQILGGTSVGWQDIEPKSAERKNEQPEVAANVPPLSPISSQMELRFSGGYGFAKGGSPASDYNETYYSSSSQAGYTSSESMQDVNDKYYTLGQGIRFEGSFIYYVQNNLGVFLSLGYSSGSESVARSMTDIYTSSYSPPSSSTDTYHSTISFGYVPIIAGLHFKASNGAVKPYAGAGAGLFFSTGISSSSSYDMNNGSSMNTNSHTEEEDKATTNTPIGYVGYVGLNFSIAPTVALFMEAKATLVSFYITRRELTKYTVNGTDQLSMMKTKDKIIEYEADKNYTQSSPADDDQPSFGGAPIPLPASSMGITVGLSIQL